MFPDKVRGSREQSKTIPKLQRIQFPSYTKVKLTPESSAHRDDAHDATTCAHTYQGLTLDLYPTSSNLGVSADDVCPRTNLPADRSQPQTYRYHPPIFTVTSCEQQHPTHFKDYPNLLTYSPCLPSQALRLLTTTILRTHRLVIPYS